MLATDKQIDLTDHDFVVARDVDFLGLNVWRQRLVQSGAGSSWEITLDKTTLVALAKDGWEPEMGEVFTIAVVGNQKVVAVAAGGGQATDDGVLFVFDVEVIG